ncbi:MAG TPA: ABC transporter ATP-binding protein [Anaerolineae bacterium]|nr:ABC transporter ATP-binding protein [Anaerolineae bacterium]
MIQVEQLTFSYSSQLSIFENLDWHVGQGEAWAVIGPSGCGKSTLLYLLTGLRKPQTGRITVAGEPVPRPSRGRTGLILQDYGLLPWATVWDNAALGLRIRRMYGQNGTRPGPAEIAKQVDFWLQRLGIDKLHAQYPGQISGGQRQRTAIARTLALEPDVLLMDEPFSSLDALTREDMQRLMLDLRAETGVTMVIVTHNIEEAVYLGQHILVLQMPPNREARVIENPQAGHRGYRHEPAFWEKCSELRQELDQQGRTVSTGVHA